MTTRRSHSLYSLIVGMAVGMLLAGLVVPSAIGNRAGTQPNLAGPSGDAARSDRVDGAAASEPGGVGERHEGLANGASSRAAATTGSPGPVAPTGTRVELRATDRGVTASTVKIGFLLLDVGSIAQFGVTVPGVDPEQQKEAFEAYLADINARGGINERTLTGVYRSFDVLSQDDQRAACLSLTEDAGVFAVLAPGGYTGPPLLCVTQEHRTPVLAADTSIPTHYLHLSRGLLFATHQHGDRQMANWATELHRLGLLRERTIGVVDDLRLDPSGKTGAALVAALGRHGHPVVHRATLSADLHTGSSQIPIEAHQMRSKNVDAVLLATNTVYSTQFAQNAETQRWAPKWFVTEWGQMSNDGAGDRMPSSFDGSLGITYRRTGEDRLPERYPETGPDRECREIYERASGKKLQRGANDYGLLLQSCALLRILAAGATTAGPDLTRERLSTAIQSLTELAIPVWPGGGFRPGKFDFADYLRTIRFSRDCKCWMPVDELRRATV